MPSFTDGLNVSVPERGAILAVLRVVVSLVFLLNASNGTALAVVQNEMLFSLSSCSPSSRRGLLFWRWELIISDSKNQRMALLGVRNRKFPKEWSVFVTFCIIQCNLRDCLYGILEDVSGCFISYVESDFFGPTGLLLLWRLFIDLKEARTVYNIL